jgi:LysM repeat protein
MKQQKVKIITVAKGPLFIFLLIAAFSMNANATFSADPCGARAAAMGGAFTAVPGGSEAACSNPATLLELSSPELTAVYGRLFSGLSDDSSIGQGYFGMALPVERYLQGPAAFSWSNTRLSDAYSESAYSVSYATNVYRGLGAGLTLKYMRRAYTSDAYTALDPLFSDGYSKSALGADLGFFYRPRANYALGLAIKNLNKPDMGIGSSDPLPVEVHTGLSYLVRSSLLDLDAAFAGPDYTVSAGAEYSFQKRYALRMGLAAGNDSRRSVTLGFGGRFGLASFDYAFSLPISGIAGTIGSHRLAFSFHFGAEAELAESLVDAAELKRTREIAALQEEKIRVLQERLNAASTGTSQPAPQPVIVAQPSQADTAMQAEITRQLNDLKIELQKSRADMEALKAKAARKPAPAPSAKPAPARPAHYTVKEGDTLESIAASVYGNSARWPDIYRANSGAVGRGGEVKPGQVLSLP